MGLITTKWLVTRFIMAMFHRIIQIVKISYNNPDRDIKKTSPHMFATQYQLFKLYTNSCSGLLMQISQRDTSNGSMDCLLTMLARGRIQELLVQLKEFPDWCLLTNIRCFLTFFNLQNQSCVLISRIDDSRGSW